MAEVTQILSQIERGDPAAAEQLLPLVYDELRKLAAAKLAHEKPGQTVQATALVHEAYLRLVDVKEQHQWDSRGHFFAAAAEAMRRILVESARRKKTLKRGGDFEKREILDVAMDASFHDDLLDLDRALDVLAEVDKRAAEVVKLRAFGGLTYEEIGKALKISTSTAKRDWGYGSAWLRREISPNEPMP